MARQPVWAAAPKGAAQGLPAFSAYPQASVTSVGEYLMLLPQLLDTLGAQPGSELDAVWLDRVCPPFISPAGCADHC